MALINKLNAIADAIRSKTGQSGKMSLDQMATAIGNLKTTFATQTKTATPSESSQDIVPDANYDGLSKVTVNAVSKTFVGSGITRRTSSDMTVSGATVTAPTGYYSAGGSKAVASGSAGTPSASKGAVSGNQISITPTVTNTTGYITGGTKNGTAVTVKASELVSGSETKTANGTYDVTNLAELIVNVSGGGGGLPEGFKAIATGTHTLASAVAGGSTFTVNHNLGETPDIFIFFADTNVATTYSMLAVMRSSMFGWRSTSYLNKAFYHANSTTTVTGADVTTSYGIKTLNSTQAVITTYSSSGSYYWRARTYRWIAIKFA